MKQKKMIEIGGINPRWRKRGLEFGIRVRVSISSSICYLRREDRKRDREELETRVSKENRVQDGCVCGTLDLGYIAH